MCMYVVRGERGEHYHSHGTIHYRVNPTQLEYNYTDNNKLHLVEHVYIVAVVHVVCKTAQYKIESRPSKCQLSIIIIRMFLYHNIACHT